MIHKGAIDKLGFIKIYNFCLSDTIKKVKTRYKLEENINHIFKKDSNTEYKTNSCNTIKKSVK